MSLYYYFLLLGVDGFQHPLYALEKQLTCLMLTTLDLCIGTLSFAKDGLRGSRDSVGVCSPLVSSSCSQYCRCVLGPKIHRKEKLFCLACCILLLTFAYCGSESPDLDIGSSLWILWSLPPESCYCRPSPLNSDFRDVSLVQLAVCLRC